MPLTEALLDRLDSLWQKGIVPNLGDLLTDFKDPEGRAELCAADLEWRWRNREFSPLTSWSANDYQSVLGDAWKVPACRQRLIDSEWLARSAWGDKPHIDDFIAQYQLSESQTCSLWEQLDQIVQMMLIVQKNGENKLEIKSPQVIELGRRNSWEPPYPAWIPETRRLVVSDVQQRYMSRKQLGLRRVRAEEIEITNFSERVTMRFNRYSLAPGQKANEFLPFVFAINHLNISVVAASN